MEFFSHIINKTLLDCLEKDSSIILLGEDIADPYGGAFRITRGLSTKFPDRVINTPISEAGIMACCCGMALRGLKPVAEVMFGDFITLCADQIINHASKFKWMYNGKVDVPIVLRIPVGGRRGYGPTHSQSLEKIFFGIPGIKIFAPSLKHNTEKMLIKAIYEKCPVLFLENKIMYGKGTQYKSESSDFIVTHHPDNLIDLSNAAGEKPELLFVTYGGSLEIVEKAATTLLLEDELTSQIIVPGEITPFNIEKIYSKTTSPYKALITVEEGTESCCWGSEIISGFVSMDSQISQLFIKIGSKDLPIPSSKISEERVLPNEDKIITKIRESIS